MSPKLRVVLTFVLVLLAVLVWGVSQLPARYDRSALGGGERAFAASLFVLAIALNLSSAVKRRKRPPVQAPDYYIHFGEGRPHAPVTAHGPVAHGPVAHGPVAHGRPMVQDPIAQAPAAHNSAARHPSSHHPESRGGPPQEDHRPDHGRRH